MKSEQIGKLAEALSKAQGQMESAKKDTKNEFFKSKYADLAAVLDAVRKPLSDNGLSVVQFVEDDKNLITTLMHISGEWISGKVPLLTQKQDMQGLGSAITYARRYSLSAMVGIAQDDDDGEAAVGRPKPDTGATIQPKAKSTEQSWVMGEQEFSILASMREAAKLSKDDLLAYMTTVIKKKPKELNKVDFDQLCSYLNEKKVIANERGDS